MSYVLRESVHVPAIKAGLSTDFAFSMVDGVVAEISDRFVKVELHDGTITDNIALSLVRKKLGILIIEIGDYKTEDSLLTPLKKSILQFTRLLLSDDYIRTFTIRSPQEFKYIWNEYQALISHLIIVGHGNAESLLFGENTSVNAREFVELLNTHNNVGEAKQVISLCCRTGSKSFGGHVSSTPSVESFIGPSSSVHGANASQFCQSYLTYLFLHGYSSSTAYEYAKVANPGTSGFSFWRKTKPFEPKNGLSISRQQPVSPT